MKKLISTAMAAIMTLSLAAPFAATVYAEDLPQTEAAQVETVTTAPEEDAATQETAQQDITQDTDAEAANAVVEQVAALFAALPKAETVATMTDAEREAVMAQVTAAINAYDALNAADGAAFLASYGALYDEVANQLVAQLLSGSGSDVSDLSLQPMEETTGVYLTLVGYSADELKNFPVDDAVAMLTDELGNKIEVDSSYTNAWFYFANADVDENHALNAGETVDLWNYNYSTDYDVNTSYTMYLVLNNGQQMSSGKGHRYIVNVEISTSQMLSGYLYARMQGTNATLTGRTSSPVFEALGMEGSVYSFYTLDYAADKEYQIYISSTYNVEELQRRGVKIDVYPVSNFLAYRDEGQPLTGAITEEVMGNGYSDTYDTELTVENCKTASNLWVIVFTQEETGRVLGYLGAGINVKAASAYVSANCNYYDGSTMQKLADSRVYGLDASINYSIDFSSTGNGVTHASWLTSYGVGFSLPEEYAPDETYYVTMEPNADIKAVYAGTYGNEETAIAAGAANITDKILKTDDQSTPEGYPVTLGNYQYVTLVMHDGMTLPVFFYAYQSTSSGGARNNLDPNFQITGVSGISNYVADMVRGVQLDTYYRRDDRYDVGGYQMVLLDKTLTADELKQLVPTFWTPEGVQVNSGSPVISGETNLENAVWSDEISNTVMYQVQVPGEKLRNYQVTFASRQDTATLLVGGPDKRYVNLTADNNFVHDILVANIGGTELTGVKVELKDAVNVKLDDYWSIGREGNDTIPAFDGTSPNYTTANGDGSESTHWTYYSSLDNVAKVRLVADGEGEISGKLVITTDNGGSREIELEGVAANPHIVSATMKDAVKYVPYSYMVVTNNMYKWNRSTFRLIDGSLPAGMKLYEATGEIYGTPTETGDFTFTVQVDYSSSRFSPSQATYTLHVADNTNLQVYNQTDEGYSIKVPLGVEQGDGTRDFCLEDTSKDQLYVSNGVYTEFVAVWLNGQRLIPNQDYTSESGSTRITIKSQTFANKAFQNDYNTIAAEFRVNGDPSNELKRTAQNFRLSRDLIADGGSGSGSASSSGSSGSSTTTTTSSAAQTAGAQAAAQAPEGATGVTLRFYVVDGQGGPVVGAAAELHSTPRYGTTDGNGCVVFSNVEFGSHTLKILDANGNVIGSKSFVLSHGGFGVDGSVITVSDGALVDIQVKAADGTLVFNNVTLPQDSAALPQTGDSFDPTLWVTLAILSAWAAAGIMIYKKKKEQV